MPARQSGSPRQQCSGAISAFVDSIDSHIILRMIRESKRYHVPRWKPSLIVNFMISIITRLPFLGCPLRYYFFNEYNYQ